MRTVDTVLESLDVILFINFTFKTACVFEDYIDLHSNDCEEAREVKDGDAYAEVKLKLLELTSILPHPGSSSKKTKSCVTGRQSTRLMATNTRTQNTNYQQRCLSRLSLRSLVLYSLMDLITNTLWLQLISYYKLWRQQNCVYKVLQYNYKNSQENENNFVKVKLSAEDDEPELWD